MDAIRSNQEETHTKIQLQDERMNRVIVDEIESTGQADDVGEKGNSEMGSIKQGVIAEVNSKVTPDSDTTDMDFEGNFTYYENVCAEPDTSWTILPSSLESGWTFWMEIQMAILCFQIPYMGILRLFTHLYGRMAFFNGMNIRSFKMLLYRHIMQNLY